MTEEDLKGLGELQLIRIVTLTRAEVNHVVLDCIFLTFFPEKNAENRRLECIISLS